MGNYKSVKQSFENCPFKIMLPKIVITEPFINIGFSISFIGKPIPIKYLVKKCTVIDKLGNRAEVILEGQSNFLGNMKHFAVVDEKCLLKSSFSVIITIITIDGESIDVTYLYEKNKAVTLKSVAI